MFSSVFPPEVITFPRRPTCLSTPTVFVPVNYHDNNKELPKYRRSLTCDHNVFLKACWKLKLSAVKYCRRTVHLSYRIGSVNCNTAVSYTHLDVYKRQG